MGNGLYTALSGAVARKKQLDTVSHNLANVDTTGYKKREMSFDEVLATEDGVNRQVDVGQRQTDQSSSSLKRTGNPLDMAIKGEGFFQIANDQQDQAVLTRNGSFQINSDGQLVTEQGNAVLNEAGNPIQIPEQSGNISISRNGQIHDEYGFIDQIGVVKPSDASQLETRGNSAFTTAQGNIQSAGNADVHQGYLEGSNVNAVKGMTDMVSIQRHFQTMTELLKTFDRMDQQAINKVGSNS